mgnify:CR=1 FL=1
MNHLDAVHRANINSTDVSTVFMYSFFLANENAGVFEDYADLLLLLVVGIFEMSNHDVDDDDHDDGDNYYEVVF